MAIKLLKAGFDQVTIFEKASSVGGVWRENTYPGIACDVPSHLYSFTFFRNPNWSQTFAPGPEIRAYLERLAAKFKLHRRIRFNKEIVKATYVEGRWNIETQDGDHMTTDVLITATGVLHIPEYPSISGLDAFKGRIFHSAGWDHSVDLRGKRVAVIGNGSSGAQIVSRIVDEVDQLHLFLRTPQWIFPLPNESHSIWRRTLWRLFPSLTMKIYNALLKQAYTGFSTAVIGDKEEMKAFRTGCNEYLASVKDAQLRRKLTPGYEVACKRLVFSTTFYAAVQRPNCKLVTDSIKEIEPTGVRTSDGELHECDVIVLATGFKSHEYFRSIKLTGEAGLSLSDAWSTGAKSFEAVGLAGFPNLFMVGGPFSTVGNLSFITCAELEAEYIVKLLQKLVQENATAIVPIPEAQQRFMDDVINASAKTVWKSGCDSWYLDERGNVSIWTKTPEAFVDMMRHGPHTRDYRLVK